MKALRITLFILLGAVVAITVYRFGFRKSIPDAPVSEQVVSILKQNDCLVCHSMDPQLPFFSSLPVIGPKMVEESYHASRFTDLESKVNEEIDDVTLSMLDHAVSYNMMPPAGYRLAHWGTDLRQQYQVL